jgi:succinoglycan biosynthesis protein ExoW
MTTPAGPADGICHDAAPGAGPAPAIAVIIPFFQRQPGLLAKAVGSALTQAGCVALVIVVDDGSPVRAASELAGPGYGAVRIIEQANAGPAAARNRGLAHVPDQVEFVAFLDSDDVWAPGHLRNAMAGFGQGADFYFADFRRVGQPSTRFESPGVARLQGEALPEGEALFRHVGDLFDSILRCAPVGTSAVAYRRAIAPALRFNEALRAGEDNLFWMALARAARMTVFSTRCEAFYGRGVNIFAGVIWRDPGMLRYLAHAAKMHRLVPKLYRLTFAQNAWNDAWRAELRRDYARNALAMLRHRQVIGWRELAGFAVAEPGLLLALARAARSGAATIHTNSPDDRRS